MGTIGSWKRWVGNTVRGGGGVMAGFPQMQKVKETMRKELSRGQGTWYSPQESLGTYKS